MSTSSDLPGREPAVPAEAALGVLCEAGSILANADDVQDAIGRVLHLAVPSLADWVAVDLLVTDGSIRRLSEPAQPRDVQAAEGPPIPPSPAAVRSAVPRVYPHLPAAFGNAPDEPDENGTIAGLSQAGFHSALLVPLAGRHGALGTMVCALADGARRYGAPDLAMAAALGAEIVLALDNARLEVRVQETLGVRNRVLSVISHDLRTPLTTIRGVLQLLARRVDPSTPFGSTAVVERLALVGRAADQLGSLIDEVLDAVRLEDGRPLELDRQSVDLVELVSRVVRDQASGAGEQQVRVETGLKALIGFWDAARLERVVAKLLESALHYGQSTSEIVLEITTIVAPREGETERKWAELDVHTELALNSALAPAPEKDGAGVSPVDLSQIFDRGRQDAWQNRRARLDLAGCRAIVERHGGTLTLWSEGGRGSTFRLLLPLDEPGQEP